MNGKDAITIAKKELPDLVIMDLVMPEMDGYKATQIIKSDPDLKDTPVLVVTASSSVSDNIKLQKVCDSLLIKPITKLELFTELIKYLDHMVNEKSDDAVSVPSSPAIPSIDCPIDTDSIIDKEQLVNILINEFDGRCREVSESMIMDDIEEFAKQLKDLAIRHQFEYLITWADVLANGVMMFDTEAIQNTLDRFGPILKSLMASEIQECEG